jgi:hypothetical protein
MSLVAGDYVPPSGAAPGITKARTGIHDLPPADDHQKGSEYFLKTFYKDVTYDTSHATDWDRLNAWQEYRHIDGALTSADYYTNLECDDSLKGVNYSDIAGGSANPYPPFIADSTRCASYEPSQAAYERVEQKLSQTMRSVDYPLSVLRSVGAGASLGEAIGEVVLPGPGAGAAEPWSKRYSKGLPMDGAKMRLSQAASGYGFAAAGGYDAEIGPKESSFHKYPPVSTSEFATGEAHGFRYRHEYLVPSAKPDKIRPVRLEAAGTVYGARHGVPTSAAFAGDILRSVPYSTPRFRHVPEVGEHSMLYVREMPKREIDAYLRSDGVKTLPHTGPIGTGVSGVSGYVAPTMHMHGAGGRPAGLSTMF